MIQTRLALFISSLSMFFLMMLAPVCFAQQQNQMTRGQVEGIVHDYIINNPHVLAEASARMQQTELNKLIGQNATSLFFSPTSPVAGNVKGDVSVVEFFDYQCPYCKHVSPTLTQTTTKDKNLRVIFKELPIFGDNSILAAKAALAANMQGRYMVMHKALMTSKMPINEENIINIAHLLKLNVNRLKNDMNSKIVAQEIHDNQVLAEKLRIPATPAFIFAKTTHGKIDAAHTRFALGQLSQDAMEQNIAQVRKNDAVVQR